MISMNHSYWSCIAILMIILLNQITRIMMGNRIIINRRDQIL